MKIVAFLQNTWVRDPDNLKRIYAEVAARGNVDVAKHRNRMITHCLFAGCLTGRRLKAAFGEDLCYAIYWEEASTEITGRPSAKVAPDFGHITAVLVAQQPDVVLTFGRLATDALKQCWSGEVRNFPHPACRAGHDQRTFEVLARQFRAEWGARQANESPL